jgi:hypothetical protein
MEIAGRSAMSESKPDPLQRLSSPDSPASPIDGPDQQALAIIERAAREMATRRPRNLAPAPDDMSAVAAPAEPAKPFEEFVPPVEATPTEEFNPAMLVDPIDEPVAAEIVATVDRTKTEEPAQEVTAADSINVRELEEEAEYAKIFELSEPVAEVTPVTQIEAETLMTPAANFTPAETIAPAASTAYTSPKIVPPVLPPARPKVAPAEAAPVKTPPAARPLYDDRFHLALTGAQSVAVAIAIFAFVMAAFGMAARGWVVAHDWSCRVGMATNSCPPAPPPKSLGRAEIPS